ncbi:MAG: DUF2586 family protein [Psychroserpens sp.]|uniref:DUF2586 family protein n=1 Tax=Psychroserpens sp. TaxID=2020870 RepID=UPI003CA1A13F
MPLPTITFNIASNGLNRLAPAIEKTPGIVITGATVADNVTLGQSYQIFSLAEAEALGIEEVGTNNFAHAQIKSFYGEAGTGTELWLMLVSDATTMEDMADVNESYAKKLITDAAGEIRVLGLVRKTAGTETIVDGIDEDSKLAVIKAQELAEYFETKYMPIRVLVSGNLFTGVPADLANYNESNFNKVAMLIANVDGSNEAAIGLALGRLAAIPSQRNIGRVKDGPVEEIAGYFTNGETIESLSDAWDSIHDKHYIFLRTFIGRSGYYFSDDVTLTSLQNDFSALGRGFVMDEAVIIAYDQMVEELGDEVPLTEAGQIHPAIIKSWQSKVETQISGLMVDEGKLSGVSVFIDENQNILQTDRLVMLINLQPVGYAKNIEVNIGFTTQINA